MNQQLTELLNIALMIILLLAAGGFVFLRFRRIQPEVKAIQEPDAMYDLNALIEYVRERMNQLTRTNLYELGLTEDEFKKRENKRAELKSALRHCAYGSVHDKQYVKDFILDMLDIYLSDEHLNLAVPFQRPDKMSSSEVFACLLHLYQQEYKDHALIQLVENYHLDSPKTDKENGETSFVITETEIRDIYDKEEITLSRMNKLEILAQMVYERYKGLGVIDDLRDMDIDGISGGVSGIIDDLAMNPAIKSCNSVWLFYKGKSIRLAFLGFGSDKELRRVCQNIYRYNKAGQLSESNGYKISEMKDGSRVVVVRPPFSETWAFFVRKFKTQNMSLESLIGDEGSELPIQFIRYLAKGRMITALTGSQGSGKTTLLMEMIRHIDAIFPLRIQEMSFELHLRQLYPERNILSFRETETVSGQAGLDLQKKTDGAVNILGEVATDEVSAWMIQMAQVASLFTLFTHHAKTTKDLILAIRNSLLKCEMFNNEKIAEQQVVSVLDFDIHLAKDVDGHRYIERITEIVGMEMDEPYHDFWKTEKDSLRSTMLFQNTTQQYYERMTDRKSFSTQNIIEYKNGRYIAVAKLNREHFLEMSENMREQDALEFASFVNTYWKA